MSWGYAPDDGPSTWEKNFPLAGGSNQSPIDIVPGAAEFDPELASKPLSVSYADEENMGLENTGHSVKANIANKSTISGGPLKNTYQLEQFHLHWGANNQKGSEHTVQGKKYPAELHLVHWNKDKYESFSQAADKPDGLAVFGIFLTVGKENEKFKPFTDCLDNIKFTGKKDSLKSKLAPKDFLPDLSKFWTYPGSLTTPPCYESVTWIVFQQVMEVSESQLKSLRLLCRGCDTDHIVDNFRPPCCLGSRRVRASFQS